MTETSAVQIRALRSFKDQVITFNFENELGLISKKLEVEPNGNFAIKYLPFDYQKVANIKMAVLLRYVYINFHLNFLIRVRLLISPIFENSDPEPLHILCI